MAAINVFKFIDIIDLGTHCNIGHLLENHFHHHWNAVLFGHLLRFDQNGIDLAGVGYTQSLTAKSFNDFTVINAIALEVLIIHVDVVKGELDSVVHLKAALCLANQAKVAVVHQHHDERQMELRANSQLFNQELEIIVTGKANDRLGWVGG